MSRKRNLQQKQKNLFEILFQLMFEVDMDFKTLKSL